MAGCRSSPAGEPDMNTMQSRDVATVALDDGFAEGAG